jgi:site-specific recombinase XerD
MQTYLASRIDSEESLFVSLLRPHAPLQISGVETMLRAIGRDSHIIKVHPHRFRRTLATKAIAKGMPIEQVQMLLGHTKIDTTMNYAIVDENNVENSYRRCIG